MGLQWDHSVQVIKVQVMFEWRPESITVGKTVCPTGMGGKLKTPLSCTVHWLALVWGFPQSEKRAVGGFRKKGTWCTASHSKRAHPGHTR